MGRSSRTVPNLITLMSWSVGLDTVAVSFTSEDLNEAAAGVTETVNELAALGAANATAARARVVKSLKDIVDERERRGEDLANEPGMQIALLRCPYIVLESCPCSGVDFLSQSNYPTGHLFVNTWGPDRYQESEAKLSAVLHPEEPEAATSSEEYSQDTMLPKNKAGNSSCIFAEVFRMVSTHGTHCSPNLVRPCYAELNLFGRSHRALRQERYAIARSGRPRRTENTSRNNQSSFTNTVLEPSGPGEATKM